ncbi:MAG: deoxyribonuclease V [Chitinophagaceae bacterium]|nr:MAG: deoxyribonuclease V [Chitinophagaceae bacterium]
MKNEYYITVDAAKKQQLALREQINISERRLHIKTIAGADISHNRFSSEIFAGIILLTYPGLEVIGYSLAKSTVAFPYIPGYLAFREVPALMKAWDQLAMKPDVVMMDGHGIAHPRRLGIAAHFGALTGVPSLGCAKKKLTGSFEAPGEAAGSSSPLLDREEQIGTVLRTKSLTKPVFVSPGNGMGLRNAVQITKKCLRHYRLPEPTRLAHQFVNEFRKGMLTAGYHSV